MCESALDCQGAFSTPAPGPNPAISLAGIRQAREGEPEGALGIVVLAATASSESQERQQQPQADRQQDKKRDLPHLLAIRLNRRKRGFFAGRFQAQDSELLHHLGQRIQVAGLRR